MSKLTKKIYVIQTHDDSSPQPLKYCETKEIAERELEKIIREDYNCYKNMWDSKHSFEEYHEAVIKMASRYGISKYSDYRFDVYIDTYNIVEKELLE